MCDYERTVYQTMKKITSRRCTTNQYPFSVEYGDEKKHFFKRSDALSFAIKTVQEIE